MLVSAVSLNLVSLRQNAAKSGQLAAADQGNCFFSQCLTFRTEHQTFTATVDMIKNRIKSEIKSNLDLLLKVKNRGVSILAGNILQIKLGGDKISWPCMGPYPCGSAKESSTFPRRSRDIRASCYPSSAWHTCRWTYGKLGGCSNRRWFP